VSPVSTALLLDPHPDNVLGWIPEKLPILSNLARRIAPLALLSDEVKSSVSPIGPRVHAQ
jgi:hypothetical protein